MSRSLDGQVMSGEWRGSRRVFGLLDTGCRKKDKGDKCASWPPSFFREMFFCLQSALSWPTKLGDRRRRAGLVVQLLSRSAIFGDIIPSVGGRSHAPVLGKPGRYPLSVRWAARGLIHFVDAIKNTSRGRFSAGLGSGCENLLRLVLDRENAFFAPRVVTTPFCTYVHYIDGRAQMQQKVCEFFDRGGLAIADGDGESRAASCGRG
jgi:hypothetical protein